MSARPDQPDHFVRWLTGHAGRPGFPDVIQASDHVPRALYGTYIRDVLSEAVNAARSDVNFEFIRGEVIDVEEAQARLTLRLADGRELTADHLVLAIGHLPGEYPIPRPLPVYRSARYVHIPWREDALAGIGPEDDVLLVGQGLTATDLIVQLATSGHRGTIHALSRQGIRPQAHRPGVDPQPLTDWEEVPPTIRAWTRRIVAATRAATAAGTDWRAVIDGLRPYSQAIWQSFSWEERGRFLRHVRPLWEAHRHRIAPQTAALLDKLIADGRVNYYAGRLQVLEADDTGVQALVRRRGTIQHVSLHVAKVINCTGPRTDYTKFQHPLLVHLLARGLIDHDPLALGINALPNGDVLRYRGGPIGLISTLGPPMKGVLWESFAVPEIRTQARQLAARILAFAASSHPKTGVCPPADSVRYPSES